VFFFDKSFIWNCNIKFQDSQESATHSSICKIKINPKKSSQKFEFPRTFSILFQPRFQNVILMFYVSFDNYRI
jgi:hypothetical protein